MSSALPWRHAFDHVEQHDFAKLFEPGEMGEGAADLAGADQRNSITRHEIPFRLAARALSRAEHQCEGWLNAIRSSRKGASHAWTRLGPIG